MGVSVRRYEEEPITGFGLWLSIWGKASKKARVALDWALSESRVILWLGVSLSHIYREKTETKNSVLMVKK